MLHSLVERTAHCSCKVLLANASSRVDLPQRGLGRNLTHLSVRFYLCMRVKIYSMLDEYEYYMYSIYSRPALHSYLGSLLLKSYSRHVKTLHEQWQCARYRGSLCLFFLQRPTLGRLYVILKQYLFTVPC